MEQIQAIVTSFYFTSVIRLLLGFFLAGIIGLERKIWSKPAGFRTHSLVGVSAVLVMLLGEYMVKDGADVSRIPAQLLSGIGFIGAGTILRDGFDVKGLTTAASLLAVTCIGLAVGAGFYIGAVIATGIVFFILRGSHLITDSFILTNDVEIHMKAKEMSKVIKELKEIFSKYEIKISEIRYDHIQDYDENKYRDLDIAGKASDNLEINELLSEIASLDRVTQVRQKIDD